MGTIWCDRNGEAVERLTDIRLLANASLLAGRMSEETFEEFEEEYSASIGKVDALISAVNSAATATVRQRPYCQAEVRDTSDGAPPPCTRADSLSHCRPA